MYAIPKTPEGASELTCCSSAEAVIATADAAGGLVVDKWGEADPIQKAPSRVGLMDQTIMKPVSGDGEGGSCAPQKTQKFVDAVFVPGWLAGFGPSNLQPHRGNQVRWCA